MTEIDATTGPTIRKVGAGEKINEDHYIISISGLTDADSRGRAAQAIFDVPGVIAVKVFQEEDKAMYDVEVPVNQPDVAESLTKAGFQLIG